MMDLGKGNPKMRITLGLALAVLATCAQAAPSGGLPTRAEARAMLAKAVAFYKKNGRDEALDAFNRRKPPFSSQGLYVFCIGPDGKLAADGEFHEFIGQSADLIKDASGKPLGQSFWDMAQKKGHGEMHYQFLDPTTHLIKPKVSYFEKIESDVCSVGTYE